MILDPNKLEDNLGELANAVVNRDFENVFTVGFSSRN
jgi:hypothetical protein